ncbi:MAG: GTPase HflX [Legionellales bacterium]|nr:GTPase HflX [Legionellales bacterium]
MHHDKVKPLEQVILVYVDFSNLNSDPSEFVELAKSTGSSLAQLFVVKRNKPCPKTFIGTGKILEICQKIKVLLIDLVIFNCDLTPSQEKNLEKVLQCRVIDRTRLILDIFAQRARTYEGKLQVELAQLQHMSTRLIRGWTHLERQKGGIGLRGPGETQLETDRRLLRDRIKKINKLLLKVRKQRAQNRSARLKSSLPIVSLVGYTNAGKSTLFNVFSDSYISSIDGERGFF